MRDPTPPRSSSLLEVLLVLLRLGATAFGGPAAHVAMFEAECVARRRWCDRRRFLDLLALANVLPGPTSTELALELGRVRAGAAGLALGGLAWIGPGAAASLALAMLYRRFGGLPALAMVLETIRPAVLVVLADALVRLTRATLVSRPRWAWAAAALGLALGGAIEPAIVLGALALGLVLGRRPTGGLAVVPVGEIFRVFVTIGATLFGSGYLLVAYLEDALVPRGWLDASQLLDAVAAGQVTPGPLFSTATFVGYLLGGLPGAAAATAGIFLPCFAFVALAAPLVERAAAWPRVRRALDVVNAVVVGCIAAVVVGLASATLRTATAVAIAGAAGAAVFGLGAGPSLVLAGAAALGVVRALVP